MTPHEVIAIVHAHYPFLTHVGQPRHSDRWNKLTEDKITGLREKRRTAWSDLVDAAMQEWEDVNNIDYHQFPGYVMQVEVTVPQADHNLVKRKRYLTACVSLIAEVFTVFFQEEYSFPLMRNDERDHYPSSHFVFIHLLPQENETLGQNFLKMKERCQQHFPAHQYIRHTGLVAHKLESQNSSGQKDMRSLFSLLFDDALLNQNVVIIN